jgi:hypothetical protein
MRNGAEERVFKSLAETFPGQRAREMEEVVETLRSMGVEPMMVEATVRRMDWSVELGLKKLFGGEAPASHREFADAVAELDQSLARRAV